MRYYAALLVFFSFLNRAQEIHSKYNIVRWPADADTELRFEQAKRKLYKNPNDESGKTAIARLAERENPYIPALNFAIQQELAQGNINRVFNLSHKGYFFNDPESMYVHAHLLLNPNLIASLSNYDPFFLRSVAADLLARAALPIALKWKKNQTEYIHFPQAAKALHVMELQNNALAHAFEMERMLDTADEKTRESVEDQTLENFDTMYGCYFIKHYLNNPELQKRGLDIFERFAQFPFFNYQSFGLFGAYQAVKKVANDGYGPHHARASYLLAYIDYQRIFFDFSIDREQLEKNLIDGASYEPTAYLMLAALADKQSQKIKWMNELSKKLDEIEPETYLSVSIALIRGYYANLQMDINHENDLLTGLSCFIKHKAFQAIRDEVAANPKLAAELGQKLLYIRDKMVVHGKSKDRADHRKIREAGLYLMQAAAQAGHEQTAWALVERSLADASTGSTNSFLEESLAQALITTQKHNENGTSMIAGADLQRILSKINPAFLSTETSQALACWYMYGVTGLLEPNERAGIACLSRIMQVGPIITQLIEDHKINGPRACLEAAVLLHTACPNSQINERNLLFGKAIRDGDMSLRKEIITYCLEYENLVEQGVCAINAYLDHLIKLHQFPDEELEFQRSFTTTLKRWAVGTKFSEQPDIKKRHPIAIMYFNDWRILDKKYPGVLKPEVGNTIQDLTLWLANQGYEPALNTLEKTEFQEIKHDIIFIDRAVSFWEAWLKTYVHADKTAEQINQVYTKIDELSAISLEKGTDGAVFVSNCRTHYRLANMFIERGDYFKAAAHVHVGEVCMKKQLSPVHDLFELIAKTNTLTLIERMADEDHAWAKYILAEIKANRMEHFVEVNHKNPDDCFKEIETIRDLLIQSVSYCATLVPGSALSLGEVDYMEASVAQKILTLHKSEDEKLKQRRDKALENAIDKGCMHAYYTWAENALEGKYGKGQEIFECAIERLCAAAGKGVTEAAYVLRSISHDGFDYVGISLGRITRPLLEKILHALSSAGISLNAVSISQEETVGYARYLLNRLENGQQVFGILKKASEAGNIRADVYLGIMYREGIHVEKSLQTAQAYFARAIAESEYVEFDRQIIQTLNIADHALAHQLGHNLSHMAHCARYRLQLAPHAIEVKNAYDAALRLVESLEKITKDSQDVSTQSLIFTSGIMKELILMAKSTTIQNQFKIAQLAVNKFKIINTAFPTLNYEAEIMRAITPFYDLLCDITVGDQPIDLMKQLDFEEIKVFIDQLQTMIEQKNTTQLRRILGVLKISCAIFSNNKALAKVGLAELEHASKQGDLEAEYAYAMVHFDSENLGGHAFENKVKKMVGTTTFVEKAELFPGGKKAGIALLRKLANKGHPLAGCQIAVECINQKKFKEAADYYRQALVKNPQSGLAADGLLTLYALKWITFDQEEKKNIVALLDTVKNDKEVELMAPLYSIYFSLADKTVSFTDEQIVDTILNSPQGFYLLSNASKICSFLKVTSLIKVFKEWVDIHKNSAPDLFMLKAYTAQAVLEYIYGSLNDENYITSMKTAIMKCCVILNKNNLKLDAAPALAKLLYTISVHGALSNNEISPNEKEVIINLTHERTEKLRKDIEWAQVIIKKYMPSALSSK